MAIKVFPSNLSEDRIAKCRLEADFLQALRNVGTRMYTLQQSRAPCIAASPSASPPASLSASLSASHSASLSQWRLSFTARATHALPNHILLIGVGQLCAIGID